MMIPIISIFIRRPSLSINLTFILCLLSFIEIKAQNDSLQVYFVGSGPKGEKFKVYYEDQLVLAFKSDGLCNESFKIPLPASRKYGTLLEIFVHRKGKLGLCFRNTDLNTYFEPGKRYYIIRRNNQLKNRYAVQHEWSDRPPILVD